MFNVVARAAVRSTLLSVFLALAACGGGDGGGDTAAPAGTPPGGGATPPGGGGATPPGGGGVTPPTGDTVAPSVPSGLQGSVNGSRQVVLTWTASTDTGGSNLAGYRITRGATQIAEQSGTGYTDTATTGASGGTYSYSVRAYDGAGNVSNASTVISVIVPSTNTGDTTPPTTPANLTATASTGQVALSWSASTDTGGSLLAGYVVFRNAAEIATVTSGTTYTNTGLTAGAAYTFTVRAIDGAGNTSTPSNSAAATVPGGTTPGSLNLGAHPRVWVNSSRMANLQAHVTANTVQWRAVKARADAQVARGTAFTGDSDEYALGDLGMACLMLPGNAAYATRAASVLSQYAVDTNTLQRDSAYDYRYLGLAVMAYDWCYNQLPVNVRQQVATWMMDRADWVWPETNADRRGKWGVDSAPNNYFWGFMTTGAAALAAYGDDTKTGAVSGTNRAEYHVDLARRKWSTYVVPFITGWARGGVFAEGTNYESTRTMAMFADAFWTSLNDTTYVADPFFQKLYVWQLHQNAPNGTNYVYLGEQARDSEGGIIYYERSHHLMLSAFPNVATATEKAISYKMVQKWPINQNSLLGLTAVDMIYWDQTVTPATTYAPLQKWFIDPTTGVVVYRTSQTDENATLVFFESGPLLESHQLFNANGLMVWKGGFWVLGHGQMSDREYDLSQSSTVYTSDGKQTWQEATGGGGKLLSWDANDAYLYTAGQAKEAYTNPNNRPVKPITDFVRKVAYLVDIDALVVADRVSKQNPASTLSWKWWGRPPAGTELQASGNTFSMTNMGGDHTIYGQNVIGGTPTANNTGTPVRAGYFVQTTSAGGAATEFAVTAMRIGSAVGASGADDGTRLNTRIGAWMVSFSKNEVASASVTLNTDASKFLVSDLTPNASYAVSGGPTVTATAAGVIKFDLAGSGSRQVTITRQ